MTLRHHLRRALIATACASLLGTAAMVASGDGPGRTISGPMGIPMHPSTGPFHLRTPSVRISDGSCIKCNGGAIEVLSDADIQRAGDDAALLVLGMREERGIGLPVFGDAPWDAWGVVAVPLADVSAPAGWSGGPGGYAPDGVVIRPPVSAVPEPGAWLTLLIGFGAVGAVMRRKCYVEA